jgi:hypothetical protein
MAGSFLLFIRQPEMPASAANGSYWNDCCGMIVLRDGRMALGETKPLDYVVQQDELGHYVLPETFVGTWEDRGFEIDGTRAPLKLRLDTAPNPSRIQLIHPRGSLTFSRREPSAL